MNPSVPHMTWIVITDSPLSAGRERHVFSPSDVLTNPVGGFDDSPMMRAYRFGRFHANECHAECSERSLSGTVEIFCREYRETTIHTIYLSDGV